MKNVTFTEKFRIFKNFSTLSILQILNLLVPLLTAPFLIRFFGFEMYGKYSVAFAMSIFLQIFLDWGFNLNNVRNVVKLSILKNEKEISGLFYRSLILKLLLYLFGIILLSTFLFIFQQLDIFQLFIGLSIGTFGICLAPTWLYQGLGNMAFIMIRIIIIKISSLFLVLLIINSVKNLYLFCILQGGFLFLGVLLLLFKEFRAREFHADALMFSKIRKDIADGWHIFWANINTVFFMNINPFIISALHDKTTVGQYAAAEKFIGAGLSFSSVLFNTTYPIVCDNLQKPSDVRNLFLKRFAMVTAFIFITGGGVFIFGADQLSYLITGKNEQITSDLIRMMSFTPLVAAMNMPAYLSLLAEGKNKEIGKIFMTTSIVSLITSSGLIYYAGLSGAVISIYLVYGFLLFYLYFVFMFKKTDKKSNQEARIYI